MPAPGRVAIAGKTRRRPEGGRAIHIHVRVTDGDQSLSVSQIFFEEALINDIFASHPEYRPFGQPDTPMAQDGVVAGLSADALERQTLVTELMSDVALLAYMLLPA